MPSAGRRFREALADEHPLQLIGVMNAYVAMMARHVGYRAIYLSGGGIASSSYGLPDLGITTLDNVLEDVRRITSVVDLPLIVDIDTGWGNEFMIAKTIKEMIRAGAAGVHIEDQVSEKRCGHRSGKKIVPTEEMVARIKAAVEAKTDDDFFIIARTDAYASEGLEKTVERVHAYQEAGAEGIFPEALQELHHYRFFKAAADIPILANITEFGKTPLFTREQLSSVDVDIILYPLSVNRAMNLAALQVLKEIRQRGTQGEVLHMMQTRDELYDFLNYHLFEEKANELIKQGKNK